MKWSRTSQEVVVPKWLLDYAQTTDAPITVVIGLGLSIVKSLPDHMQHNTHQTWARVILSSLNKVLNFHACFKQNGPDPGDQASAKVLQWQHFQYKKK